MGGSRRRMLIAIGALALAGCNPFASATETQTYTSAATVIEHSTMPFTPPTATRVKYVSEHFLDRYEYLYFEDRRERVDGFVRALIGSVPDRVGRYPRWMGVEDLEWWPEAAPALTRSGEDNGDDHGLREVFIVDGPERSQVWALAVDHH